MSVKKEASGRRSIQVETIVPGTPEQVWEAIATGPGISAWFVPTEVEPRVGGALRCFFGPGMESTGTVTSWNPPHLFAAESPGSTPEAPPMAHEWTVEARSGGNCVVRVVHSLFADGDEWDDQLEGSEAGWPRFFAILRLYLTHFQGQACSSFSLIGAVEGSESEVWGNLIRSLGLSGASPGQSWSTPADGIPPLSGIVEEIGQGNQLHGLSRLQSPAPGIISMGAFSMAGQTHLSMTFYFYGDEAEAAVSRHQPSWESWIKQLAP